MELALAQLITRPSAAMRLARTIASDILIYNREAVLEGLANDDLFERLSEQISEAHKHFAQRTTAELRSTHNFIERALVDVLVYRSADSSTTCW